MEREIKFKGKRIDNGEWIYGDIVQWKRLGLYAILPQEGDEWDTPSDYRVNPESVGQFTGFTDKNGVEIYEGDLLKYPGYCVNMLIIFSQEEYRFRLIPNSHTVPYLYDKELEVVGNIHDNQTI